MSALSSKCDMFEEGEDGQNLLAIKLRLLRLLPSLSVKDSMRASASMWSSDLYRNFISQCLCKQQSGNTYCRSPKRLDVFRGGSPPHDIT
jgi:hypothetical protein